MKRWRSPLTSRRTVHAELKCSGCPLSPEELRILAKLKEQDEQPGEPDDDNSNNARRDRGRGGS